MIEMRWVDQECSHDELGARYDNWNRRWVKRVLQFREVVERSNDGLNVDTATAWRDVEYQGDDL